MRLSQIKEVENRRKFYFEEYLREDFVSRGLIVSLREDNSISSLSFNSTTFGTMTFDAEKGLTSCFGWESDDKLRSLSYISKHYKSHFINSSFNPDLAALIYSDIGSRLPDDQIKSAIDQFIVSPEEQVRLDLSDYSVEPKEIINLPFSTEGLFKVDNPEAETPEKKLIHLGKVEKIKPAFDLKSRELFRSCDNCYQSIFVSEPICKHCGFTQPEYKLPATVNKILFRFVLIPAFIVTVIIVLLIQVSLVTGL